MRKIPNQKENMKKTNMRKILDQKENKYGKNNEPKRGYEKIQI